MRGRGRTILLVLVLLALAGYYGTQHVPAVVARWRTPPIPVPPPLVDNSASLRFDEPMASSIRHYFEGVVVEPQENTLDHAISLDHSVGRPQIARGEHREAYRTYQKVLAISYRQGSLMGIGIALNVMADMADRAGDVDESLATTLLTYKVAQQLNNKEEMGVVELSFARRLRDRDPAASMLWMLRAKESLKTSRYKEDYVRALPGLARGLRELRQDDKASALLAEAWVMAQALGNSPTQKWTRFEVAMAYSDDLARAGRHAEALEVLKQAQSVFAPGEKSTDTYTEVLYRLGRVHAALKKPAEAGHYYLSAYANYEVTRAAAPGEKARAKLDGNHKDFVDDFVDHHLRSGDTAGALALLESNKARTLNDIFEDPSYKDAQDQWREMERRHAREVAGLLESAGDELLPIDGRERWPKLAALMTKHDDERRSLQTTLQLKEMIVTRSLSPDHVRELARRLPPDVAVLSYFESGSRVSLFLVTRQGVRHLPLLEDAAAFNRTLHQLRVALTNPHNDFYREPARWLYRRILEPAVRTLPATVTILVYSPDGLLSRVPLEALIDGGRFVGERFAVYRVPSLRYATAIGAVKAPPAQHGIACVDPDLPNARLPFQQETGRALEKLYGKRVTSLSGRDCSETRLVAAIDAGAQPGFLHIGAHGNFYPIDPMESAIWLSPGEESAPDTPAWSAKAMATVDMRRLDLVTLSSCESGLTDSEVPRDVFGIARALFFAGARAIVAPLWAVDDRATAEYMKAFHTAYGRQPAVLALQQAQNALRRTERYRHPFYWSAFVLTGATR